jgi:hypothetical protein
MSKAMPVVRSKGPRRQGTPSHALTRNFSAGTAEAVDARSSAPPLRRVILMAQSGRKILCFGGGGRHLSATNEDAVASAGSAGQSASLIWPMPKSRCVAPTPPAHRAPARSAAVRIPIQNRVPQAWHRTSCRPTGSAASGPAAPGLFSAGLSLSASPVLDGLIPEHLIMSETLLPQSW